MEKNRILEVGDEIEYRGHKACVVRIDRDLVIVQYEIRASCILVCMKLDQLEEWPEEIGE
jgi:hypothetical protein